MICFRSASEDAHTTTTRLGAAQLLVRGAGAQKPARRLVTARARNACAESAMFYVVPVGRACSERIRMAGDLIRSAVVTVACAFAGWGLWLVEILCKVNGVVAGDEGNCGHRAKVTRAADMLSAVCPLLQASSLNRTQVNTGPASQPTPLRASQSSAASSPRKMVRSLEADATIGSLGWKATSFTLPLWPGSAYVTSPDAARGHAWKAATGARAAASVRNFGREGGSAVVRGSRGKAAAASMTVKRTVPFVAAHTPYTHVSDTRTQGDTHAPTSQR